MFDDLREFIQLDEFERLTAIAVDQFRLDEADSLVGLAREYAPALSSGLAPPDFAGISPG